MRLSRSFLIFLLAACSGWVIADPCSAEVSAPALTSFASPADISTSINSTSTGNGRFVLGQRSIGFLLGMGGAALISKSFENPDRIATALDAPPFDHVLDVGDTFGDGITAGVGALGLLAAGRVSGSERLTAAGGDLTESLLLTWGSVWTLKVLVDSERPNGGKHSFPSGHTATAFAMAPVLTKHFGWKVGVPTYALATATALARMEESQHYIADVLFGAALGLVIGSEVTSKSCLCVVKEHLAVKGRGLGVKVNF